jgi:hypothetical protein
MNSTPEESRRSEILNLYQQGTITAGEMEHLLSEDGARHVSEPTSLSKSGTKKSIAWIVLAVAVIAGTVAAVLVQFSGGNSGISTSQVQSEIDATRESLLSQTTTTDPKAEQRRREVADYQSKMDACSDKAYVAEFYRLNSERVKELIKPQNSLAGRRTSALLIGKQIEAYEAVMVTKVRSDSLAVEASDVAHLTSNAVDAFRQAAAISNEDDFRVALTDASLTAGDLDRAIYRLIDAATKICGNN